MPPKKPPPKKGAAAPAAPKPKPQETFVTEKDPDTMSNESIVFAQPIEETDEEHEPSPSEIKRKEEVDEKARLEQQAADDKRLAEEKAKRELLALQFEHFISESGLKLGMELIFTEMLTKKVPSEQQFVYTIARLKQIAE